MDKKEDQTSLLIALVMDKEWDKCRGSMLF